MSVGEEVAGGDAADGLMDVQGRDLSGSSAIQVQAFVASTGCFRNIPDSFTVISELQSTVFWR